MRVFTIVLIGALLAAVMPSARADDADSPTIVSQPMVSAVVGSDTRIIIPNPGAVKPAQQYAISGQDAIVRASIVQPDKKHPLEHFSVVSVRGVSAGMSVVHVLLGMRAFEVPVTVYATLADAAGAMKQPSQTAQSVAAASPASGASRSTPTPTPTPTQWCTTGTDAFDVSSKRLTLENATSTTLYIVPSDSAKSKKGASQQLSPFGQYVAAATPTPTATPTFFPVVVSKDTTVAVVPTPGASQQSGGQFAATISAQSPGNACIVVSSGSDRQDVLVHVLPRRFVVSYGINHTVGTTLRNFTTVPVPTPFFTGSGTPPPTPSLNTIQETSRTNQPINGMLMGHVRITQWEMYNLWLSLGTGTNSSGLIYGLSLSPGRSDSTFFTLGVQQVVTQQLLPPFGPGNQIPSSITSITEDVKRPAWFFGFSVDGKALGCLVAVITSATTGSSACKSNQ